MQWLTLNVCSTFGALNWTISLISIMKLGILSWLDILKPGFHMSGKSQTIGDFTFLRPSQILPIYRICARDLSQIFPIMNYLFVIGGLEPSNLGDW